MTGIRDLIPELSAHERRLLGLLGAATFFNQYDLGLFSLLLVQIQEDLAIPEARLGFLGSFVRMGSLPAFVGMVLADRLGRRSVLLWTIVGYTVATAATAFSPSYPVFGALQFSARMFMAAEGLLAIVVIIEEFHPRHRGWGIGVLGVLAVAGRGIAMVLFAGVESVPFGWRGLYLVGIVPLLLVAWFRRGLPETRRFMNLQETAPAGDALRAWLRPVLALVKRYPGRFAAVAGLTFLWGFSNGPTDFFLPKFVQEVHGLSPATYATIALTAGTLGMSGFLVAGRLSDRYGRRPLGILFAVAEPLGAIALYTVIGELVVPIFAVWAFASVSNDVVLSAFRSELFPTSYRSTAAGAVAIIGTAGSVLELACEGLLFDWFDTHWLPVRAIAAAGLVMPLIVWATYPETSGRALEDISPEQPSSPQLRAAPRAE